MVNFKLGNDLWSELINMTRAGDKENVLSPRQESNPGPPEHMAALHQFS